jgi:alkanesulfonate monooxygenase SsuD/methylene tetrahydromethanopterin reductase-like flavin-dependent oxidoreductase (luciferase family)
MSTNGTVRIGLKIGGQDTTADELRAAWQVADEAGFDHLWCLDLYTPLGKGAPDRPIFEGWAQLAAMAVVTKRIRIGCAYTGNTHRPPWTLAKLAVTVDHLSGGRLEFGIGAGYEETEHRMYDIGGLDHRVGRLSESLACLKLLWTKDRVDFAGRYYTLRDAIANPKPVQKPHPPIWIGAGGDRLLRLVAKHADVWNCPGGARVEDGKVLMTERLGEATRKLEEACADIGRDPRTIRRSAGFPTGPTDPAMVIENCARWLEAGYTEIMLSVSPPGVARAVEKAAALLPELRRISSAVSSRSASRS